MLHLQTVDRGGDAEGALQVVLDDGGEQLLHLFERAEAVDEGVGRLRQHQTSIGQQQWLGGDLEDRVDVHECGVGQFFRRQLTEEGREVLGVPVWVEQVGTLFSDDLFGEEERLLRVSVDVEECVDHEDGR